MPRPPTHPTRPTTRRTPRGEPYPARRPASSRYTLVCHPPNCPCPNHRRRVSNDRQVDNQQQPPVNDASPPSANRRASPPVLPSVEPLAFGYRSLSLSVPSLEEASEPEDDLDLARPTLSTCGSCSASVSSDEDLPTPVHESRRPASSSNGRSLYERSRSSRALFAADQYALSLRRGNSSLPASGYISFDSPPPDTLFAESVRDFIASGFRDWPDFGFHNKMLIKVRTLTGKEIELDIDRDFKVSKIKERVEEKEGIPPVQQRLIYGGKQMADEKTAEDYNLEGGATLHLVLALRGGGLA